MAADGGKPLFSAGPQVGSAVAILLVAAATLCSGLGCRSQRDESTGADSTAGAPATSSLEAQRQAAERLAGDWLSAFRERNVDRLLALVETPYYWGGELLLSREAIAAEHRKIFARPSELEGVQIERIRARTIAEMRNDKADVLSGPVFRSMSFDDADWGIEVHMQRGANKEGLIMFARVVSGQLRIVAAWE